MTAAREFSYFDVLCTNNMHSNSVQGYTILYYDLSAEFWFLSYMRNNHIILLYTIFVLIDAPESPDLAYI